MKYLVQPIACLALVLPALAHAQIYMCKDASGRTLTSDRPIPECADRAVREFGKDGAKRRDLPPPPTAEERRQQKLDEEKRKADALAAEERAKSDRLLLERYATEKDIEAARRRALELVQDHIKREEASVAAADKQLTQVRAEEEAQKKKGAAPTPDLKRRLDEAAKALAGRTKSMEDYKAEAAKINTKYDEILTRFREIKSQGVAKSAATAPK